MRWMAAGAAAVMAAVPGVASAQTAEQRAAAEALFQQAKKLVESGDYADACPKFVESERLDPGIGTMLWLGDCFENNGQTASAWETFTEAATAAAKKHDPREHVARESAAKLEPKLSRLLILVPAASVVEGIEVRRDGVPIGRAEWGIPVPIDPGVHSVSASAAGHVPWSSTVQVAHGASQQTVAVPLLDVAAGAPPVVAAPTALPPSAAPEHSTRMSTARIAGLAIAGAGVAAVGVSIGLVVAAKSTYDESNDGAPPPCNTKQVCSQQGLNDRSSASTLADAATGTMIAGAAALVGGGLLFLFAPKSHALIVAPTATDRSAGVLVSGAW